MSKFLNLFFKKTNKDEAEIDSLNKLLPTMSKGLCNVEFKFHDHLQNENPFSLEIEFENTPEFADLLLSSGIVLKQSYDHIYKKLNEKKQLIQQMNYKKQKDNDDVISSLVSIFKASESSIDIDSLEIITQLDEAMHFLGRIPNRDFMVKYKKAVEIAFNCKIFDNTEYALNLNIDIDIDESTEDDSELAFDVINHVLNSCNSVCKSFSSTKDRTRFSQYCKTFIYDLCSYLIKFRYQSLDKSRQDIFIDYYTNSPVYSISPLSSEENEYMFKSNIESDYRIEHYISNSSSYMSYYFRISFVNDYVIERLNLGSLENSLEESLEYLLPVVSFTTRTKFQWDEEGYRSSPYIINCNYSAKLLSDYIEGFMNNYIEKHKQVIKDYICEKVKKELS